jgi:hypothetical protein
MTNSPCKYCGEHHHYTHELVCDNVRTLYPLWDSRAEIKEIEQIPENYFTEDIKSLKNDYMILNTSRLNAINTANQACQERDMALRQLKLANAEIYRLKNNYASNSQE